MPLQYGLRWFRIPSRFLQFLHIPYLTHGHAPPPHGHGSQLSRPPLPIPTLFWEKLRGCEGILTSVYSRLESKDPETSTECARPSRSTSLTRIFWYWLYVYFVFRLSIWTKTVTRIQSWNIILSRNKISLLFFCCRLFRTDRLYR